MGKMAPILGGLKITHNCNLKCQHCPYWRRKGFELNFEQVKEIIDRMQKMGVKILIIEGGEPFLWKDTKSGKDLKDIVDYAKKLFFSVGVTTNGTFSIKNFPSDVVWVSFDGMYDTYQMIRGGVFDKVVQNIKESDHKNLYVNITINKMNKNELENMVEFISPLVKGITIQFHYPYGIESDDQLFIPLNERSEVIDRLIKLKKKGYKIADSYGCLQDMKKNEWKCFDWMLCNADPDGTIETGCYLKNRGQIDCKSCGFAAHVEISKALDFYIPAILVGRKIFKYRAI